MNLNTETVNLIKSFEGLMLRAYKDSVGVWTIGYGHTSMAGAPVVKVGMILTEKEATDLLVSDLKKYQAMVDRNLKVALNDNQYGALVSFTYNLGEGNLKSSTLLRKVNAKDFAGAAKEFAKWNKAGGKVLAGLTRRRAAEAALFAKASVTTLEKPVEAISEVPAVVQPLLDHVPVAPPVASAAPSGLLGMFLTLLKLIFGGKN